MVSLGKTLAIAIPLIGLTVFRPFVVVQPGTVAVSRLAGTVSEKWDGHLPQVSGGATPFVNIPTPAASPSPAQ